MKKKKSIIAMLVGIVLSSSYLIRTILIHQQRQAKKQNLERIAAVQETVQSQDQKKAEDILVLDLTGLSDVCDYFVICTGGNARLADAIVDEVREKVTANCGIRPISTEGRDGLNWILIDYGSVVVHVFQPEVRSYYRLERLWADAPRVELDIEGAMTSEIPYADLPEDALAPAFELSEDDLVDNLPESADPTE